MAPFTCQLVMRADTNEQFAAIAYEGGFEVFHAIELKPEIDHYQIRALEIGFSDVGLKPLQNLILTAQCTLKAVRFVIVRPVWRIHNEKYLMKSRHIRRTTGSNAKLQIFSPV